MGYTSDLTTGKVIEANELASPGEEAEKAIDDNLTTYWQSKRSMSNNWIRVDFGAGNTETITKLRVHPVTTFLGTFTFQGSNDGAAYTDLTSGTASTDAWHDFEFTNTTAYRYYRIIRPASGWVAIKEIEMMATEAESGGQVPSRIILTIGLGL